MKELTTAERYERANEKSNELIDTVFRLANGEKINLNHVRRMIRDIYKDELELIDLIDDYDLDMNLRQKYGPEVPSFMIVRNGEAQA